MFFPTVSDKRRSVYRPLTSFIAVMSLIFCTLPLAQAKNEKCVFDPVADDWQVSNTRWIGSCGAGRAQGVGVLRHLTNGKPDKIFYGRLKDGQPVLGVIHLDEGAYIAGKFKAGKFDDSDDGRAVVISALREAEKAANAVAARFEKEGNRESAKYYRARAKQWSQESQ